MSIRSTRSFDEDTQTSQAMLSGLRSRIDAVMRPLIGGRTVAVVDYPNHTNCGDSAIWMGEEAMFARVGAEVIYRTDLGAYRGRHIMALPADTVVLDHGGGNFGDLYPWHHELRERLLRDVGDRSFIQLPQSTRFSSQEAIDNFRQALAQAPNALLLLRDRVSLEFARDALGANSQLCPDMAFMIEGLRRSPGNTDVFVLARTDTEASSPIRPHAVEAGYTVDDWIAKRKSRLRNQHFLYGKFGKLPTAAFNSKPFQAGTEAIFSRWSEYQVQFAVDMLSQGRVVITDRLHAQVLCELAGIPNVAVDTGYGKISALHEAWLSDSTTSHMASSFEEAEIKARELLASINP